MRDKMYAVGPEDEHGWEAIRAKTKISARREFLKSNAGLEGCKIEAVQVPTWDNLRTVTGPDWIKADFAYSCCGCSEITQRAYGAHIIDGEVFCGECANETTDQENTNG